MIPIDLLHLQLRPPFVSVGLVRRVACFLSDRKNPRTFLSSVRTCDAHARTLQSGLSPPPLLLVPRGWWCAIRWRHGRVCDCSHCPHLTRALLIPSPFPLDDVEGVLFCSACCKCSCSYVSACCARHWVSPWPTLTQARATAWDNCHITRVKVCWPQGHLFTLLCVGFEFVVSIVNTHPCDFA